MPTIRQYHHNRIIQSTRPLGGFFIPVSFPKKIRAELTKVNKPIVTDSLSNYCKDTILPSVKPAIHNVITWLTKWGISRILLQNKRIPCPPLAGVSRSDGGGTLASDNKLSLRLRRRIEGSSRTLQTMFKIHRPYPPAGDQPQAITELVKGINEGEQFQTLLGVTGSGKTFTMANVIQEVQKPTLVITHNKTLVAQLYGEFRQFFPDNAVEYFVSYYDYYQPEAYIPTSDTYIEKDLSINEELDKLRHGCGQLD